MSKPHFTSGEGWNRQGGFWEGLCELFLLPDFGIPEGEALRYLLECFSAREPLGPHTSLERVRVKGWSEQERITRPSVAGAPTPSMPLTALPLRLPWCPVTLG